MKKKKGTSNGPQGYKSVRKTCTPLSGNSIIARAMKAFTKSSVSWYMLANVSRWIRTHTHTHTYTHTHAHTHTHVGKCVALDTHTHTHTHTHTYTHTTT